MGLIRFLYFLLIYLIFFLCPCTSIWHNAKSIGNVLNPECMNEYISTILKYALSHNDSTEIMKHIIVCNYYCISILTEHLENLEASIKCRNFKSINPETLFNFIANAHNDNDGIGVNRITWEDLRKNNGIKYEKYGDPDIFNQFIWFDSKYFLKMAGYMVLLIFYDLLVLVGLFITYNNTFNSVSIVLVTIHCVFDMINIPFQIKYIISLYYCHHL